MTEMKDVLLAAFNQGQRHMGNVIMPDGGIGVFVPEGYHLQKFDPIVPPEPTLTMATTKAGDLASFVALVNRYKIDGQSAIFSTDPASIGLPSAFRCIIDYHKPAAPGRCLHSITYTPKHSEQWEIWTAASSGKSFKQADFAEFIEDNSVDIITPSSASVLDLISNFKASRKVEFDSVVHQSNGSTLLAYGDTVDGGHRNGSMAVPTELEINIPVFHGGARWRMKVFLRYKLGDSKVSFSLKMDRPRAMETEAMEQMMDMVINETGIIAFNGTP
ncbi:MAG: DUF2303 family protein [Anaerolineae bacterium]|nr:DUF2303 family protein [Anaerolineae bacterium]